MVEKALVLFKRYTLVIALVVIMLCFSVLSDSFLTTRNMLSLLRQISLYGIMSCGMVFVLVGGNLDLTAGALLTLCCCVMVRLHDGLGPIPAMLITVCVGLTFGLITGLLVGQVGLNGLITTLGMQSIISAIAKIYTQSQYFIISTTERIWFSFIGQGSVFYIPTQFLIYIVLLCIFQVILSRSKYGYQLRAVGGNKEASSFSGIKSKNMITQSYIVSGFCISIAGIVLAARGLAAEVTVGEGFEFDVLAACVLSGTSLLGGHGSVSKAFLGVIIMGCLRNGYVMLGLPYYLQWLTQCIVILLVVGLDMSERKKVAS